jgi:hypothetical protein
MGFKVKQKKECILKKTLYIPQNNILELFNGRNVALHFLLFLHKFRLITLLRRFSFPQFPSYIYKGCTEITGEHMAKMTKPLDTRWKLWK